MIENAKKMLKTFYYKKKRETKYIINNRYVKNAAMNRKSDDGLAELLFSSLADD